MLGVFIVILLSKGASGNYYTHYYGSMTSPSYPYHAGHDMVTTNIINAGSTLISLRFNVLDTEACCDFIMVYNSEGLCLHKLSGSYNNFVTKSDTYFRVVYTTDVSIDSTGYYASWHVAPSTSLRQTPPFTFGCGYLEFVKVSSAPLALYCREQFSSPDFKDCFNVCSNDDACSTFQFVGGTCTVFGYGTGSNPRENLVWNRK